MLTKRQTGDILERLRGYNPPDRTIEPQTQIAWDIQDAAAEIERLRAALEKSFCEKNPLVSKCGTCGENIVYPTQS